MEAFAGDGSLLCDPQAYYVSWRYSALSVTTCAAGFDHVIANMFLVSQSEAKFSY